MRMLMSVLLVSSAMSSSSALADATIGQSYCAFYVPNSPNGIQVLNPANNIAGLYIRTISLNNSNPNTGNLEASVNVGVNVNDWHNILGAGAGQVGALPFPLYIPPGHGVFVAVGNTQAGFALSYDLVGQPISNSGSFSTGCT